MVSQAPVPMLICGLRLQGHKPNPGGDQKASPVEDSAAIWSFEAPQAEGEPAQKAELATAPMATSPAGEPSARASKVAPSNIANIYNGRLVNMCLRNCQ